ncbi:MAG: hypothetical protein LC107_00975 [Chitinophagales bacterium]|nr:hypothetical protein [Chitinophagales bacterium]
MTIAIDFDGVIHQYSRGYADGSIYDVPVKGAARFIYDCMFEKGWAVFILSTREPQQIKTWLEQVLFQGKALPFKITILSPETKFWNSKKNLGITNRKIAAHVYIDDRGMRFDGNFDGMLEQLEVLKTWQGK